VNQMTDTTACGSTCKNCNSLPFVTGPFCNNGACDYQACSGGWINCSGNRADGCPCLAAYGCNSNGTCVRT
jgi:hypothetical protein